ncbi:hypothetical protein TALC_00373 [Thermoplasmatales archaeon BRNA1]|nr:hypothetical protein TALC_00373 [Thermoplasmatales archaeon BRNA1]
MFENDRPKNNENIYLNIVVRINDDWAKLTRHLEEMDTKVAYLRTFEMSLSPACSQPLWQIEEYKAHAKMFPLPDSPYARLPFDTFRAQMAVYESIMRSEGLIGKKSRTVLGFEEAGV